MAGVRRTRRRLWWRSRPGARQRRRSPPDTKPSGRGTRPVWTLAVAGIARCWRNSAAAQGTNTEIKRDAGRGRWKGPVALSAPGNTVSTPPLEGSPVSRMPGIRGYRLRAHANWHLQPETGCKRDKPQESHIRISTGSREARSAPCSCSASNGSRSVTTSATLDRWQGVPAESILDYLPLMPGKALWRGSLSGTMVRHSKGGVFMRGNRSGAGPL
jgi:hypothetical protein